MFAVTRQHRWEDGLRIVEISCEGLDHCSPDALCRKYTGEFEEFPDPTDAVEAAIDIAESWRRDTRHRIHLGMGSLLDFCLVEAEPLNRKTRRDLRARAKKLRDNLPKCDECGDLLPPKPFRVFDFPDFAFCREYCAEEFWTAWSDDEEEE